MKSQSEKEVHVGTWTKPGGPELYLPTEDGALKNRILASIGKKFLLNQLFRFSGWVCMLELARIRKENKEEIRELDIRKEAFGLILRTSQKHYIVKDSSEMTVNGIHCLHPRLEKGVAQQIYGTSNIPILSNKDSVTVKFFREAHWVKGDVCRGMHNLTKTTLANVLRGEGAVFWKGQQRQIRNGILDCGTCRKFSERLCRPYLGKSMFRCRVGSPPFEYVSIDPLDQSEYR